LMGAFAIMAALYRRERDPAFDGEWVDLALFETLFRLIEWQVIVHDQLGVVPERSGNRLAVAPAAVINTYQSRDGDWITVTSATPRSVLNVVRLLGLDEADYATVEAQTERRHLLDEALRGWIAERPTDEALRELADAEVVASRIFSIHPGARGAPTLLQGGDPARAAGGRAVLRGPWRPARRGCLPDAPRAAQRWGPCRTAAASPRHRRRVR